MSCVRYYLEPVGVAAAAGSFTDGPFTLTVKDHTGAVIAREIRGPALHGLRTGYDCEITFAASSGSIDLVLINGTPWTVTGYGTPAAPVVLSGASSATPRVLSIAIPGLWRVVIAAGNETKILEMCI